MPLCGFLQMETLIIPRRPPAKTISSQLPLDAIALLAELADYHQTSRAKVLTALIHDAGKRLLPKDRQRKANGSNV